MSLPISAGSIADTNRTRRNGMSDEQQIRALIEAWASAPAGEPDADARTTQQHAAVAAALAGLPAPWRHVVMARYLARCDDQRVAADLGLTVKQVRDILARARAATRDELDQARTDGPR